MVGTGAEYKVCLTRPLINSDGSIFLQISVKNIFAIAFLIIICCRYRWTQRPSSMCSVTCGGGGVQSAVWVCGDSRGVVVDQDLCDPAARPRGRDTMPCGHHNCDQPPHAVQR